MIGFRAIAVDEYVRAQLENEPTENEKDLRERLMSALEAYQQGVKCACGNDIWVIGSSSAGYRCFTCITGEDFPLGDFEIDVVVNTRKDRSSRKHIDEMEPGEIFGIFTDDGYQVDVDLIAKPLLCLSCVHNDDPNEELLCNLNRMDQKDEKNFVCFAYKNFRH